MISLSRLLVLLMVAAVITAQRRGRRPRPPASRIDTDITVAPECFPEDFEAQEFPECKKLKNEFENVQCLASRTGIADESGYNSMAAYAYVEGLTEDEEWIGNVQELLNICNTSMDGHVPAEKQGAFMYFCVNKLLKFQCNVMRAGVALAEIDEEKGAVVGGKFAYLVGGACIMALKNPEKQKAWEQCANETELDNEVFEKAGLKYFEFVKHSGDMEPPKFLTTEDEVEDLGEQLDNFNATVYCTMRATGEITEEDELDVDRIRENLNGSSSVARGPDYFKMAATKVLDYCLENFSSSPDEFISCRYKVMPFICTSLTSHAFLVNPRKPQIRRGRRPAVGCGGQTRRGRRGRRPKTQA